MIYVNFYKNNDPNWWSRTIQYFINLFSPQFVHVDIQLHLIKQEVVHGKDKLDVKDGGEDVLVTSSVAHGVQIYDMDTPSRKPAETYMLAVDVETAWSNIYPILGKRYSFFGYPTAVFDTPRKKTQGLSCVETVNKVLDGCVGRNAASAAVISYIQSHSISELTPRELRDVFKKCGVPKL
jgi:hypothetical protein